MRHVRSKGRLTSSSLAIIFLYFHQIDTDDTLIAVIDKRFGLGVLIEPTDLFVEGLVTYVNFTLEEAPAHSCFVTFSMFDEAKSQAE